MEKMVLTALALGLSLPVIASERVVDMYKSEHCGYCSLWGKAIEKDGFRVQTHIMNDQALPVLKEKYSVPAGLHSYRTVVTGELVIEGHVPATTIHQAVQLGSGTYGLATPGIPTGSPGMETGDRREAYDVVAFAPGGSQNVFQRIKQTLVTGRRHHPV